MNKGSFCASSVECILFFCRELLPWTLILWGPTTCISCCCENCCWFICEKNCGIDRIACCGGFWTYLIFCCVECGWWCCWSWGCCGCCIMPNWLSWGVFWKWEKVPRYELDCCCETLCWCRLNGGGDEIGCCGWVIIGLGWNSLSSTDSSVDDSEVFFLCAERGAEDGSGCDTFFLFLVLSGLALETPGLGGLVTDCLFLDTFEFVEGIVVSFAVEDFLRCIVGLPLCCLVELLYL